MHNVFHCMIFVLCRMFGRLQGDCVSVSRHIFCNSPTTYASIFIRKVVIKELMNIQGFVPNHKYYGVRGIHFTNIIYIYIVIEKSHLEKR